MRKIRLLFVPALLGALSLAWTVPRLDDVGVTIDEPQYFFSVERIQNWYALLARQPGVALRDSTIREAWDPADVRYYNPHPPAYKQLMAITEGLSGQVLGPVSGYRLAPALQFALLVFLVSAAAGVLAGPVAAAGAGLALFAMPRLVGHAHVAATDMPLTLFWFVAAFGLAAHGLRGSRSALVVGGIALGFAMATKFTGWLLPAAVLPWCLIERRLRGFLPWVGIGLLVAWILTPPAWMHPVEQLHALFGESMTREIHTEVSTRYFGVTYGHVVPWHHPLVMTAITLPLGVLALFSVGLADFLHLKSERGREAAEAKAERPEIAGLAVIQVLFFLALVAMPQSPNHDGVRQWLPMFPFVAFLAGTGLARLARIVAGRVGPATGHRSMRSLVAATLAVVFLLPGVWQTVRTAPFYLSYYSGLIGGLPGAHARGMEVSYWNDAITPGFLRAMERRLPPGAVVVGHPSPAYFWEMQELGLVRGDLRFEVIWPAPYLLMTARMSYTPGPVPVIYERDVPLVRTALDGITLAGLYGFPEAGDAGTMRGRRGGGDEDP